MVLAIHTNRHYDNKRQHLVGYQAMRMRLLRNMGFKVMQLDYDKISRLRQNPAKLKEVLETALNDAC